LSAPPFLIAETPAQTGVEPLVLVPPNDRHPGLDPGSNSEGVPTRSITSGPRIKCGVTDEGEALPSNPSPLVGEGGTHGHKPVGG